MTVIDSRPDGETWSSDESTEAVAERPKRRATRSSRSTDQARVVKATALKSTQSKGTQLPFRDPGFDRPGSPVEEPEAEELPRVTVASAPAGEQRGERGGKSSRSRRGDRSGVEDGDRASGVDLRDPSNEREPSGARSAPLDDRNAPTRHKVVLDEGKIDPDVIKVLKRLVRHGYEAYLVGGCVRDLLLDHRPKDFDVATSARPEQVRALFRNSRVIGRRFRLVHVLFQGGKVIEVATFRRAPREGADGDPDSLLIRADNVFGEAFEDATRRDFTINALFYDVEVNEILDWVGGMQDIAGRVVNTIGDPDTRFHEDPVRLLRALKFAGRLDVGITPEVYDAIVRCRESLERAARPRVSEEILRLMRGGAARRTIYLAWETGVLDVLLPELAALLYDSAASDKKRGGTDDDSRGARVFRLLDLMDQRAKREGPYEDAILWTILLLEPLKEACEGVKDRAAAIADFLEPFIERLAIPRRFVDTIRRVLGVLPRIQSGRGGRFARTELFQIAVTVAELDLLARRESTQPLASFLSDGRGPSESKGSDQPNPGGTGRYARDADAPRPERGGSSRGSSRDGGMAIPGEEPKDDLSDEEAFTPSRSRSNGAGPSAHANGRGSKAATGEAAAAGRKTVPKPSPSSKGKSSGPKSRSRTPRR